MSRWPFRTDFQSTTYMVKRIQDLLLCKPECLLLKLLWALLLDVLHEDSQGSVCPLGVLIVKLRHMHEFEGVHDSSEP